MRVAELDMTYAVKPLSDVVCRLVCHCLCVFVKLLAVYYFIRYRFKFLIYCGFPKYKLIYYLPILSIMETVGN
jgi:hypothetical protein